MNDARGAGVGQQDDGMGWQMNARVTNAAVVVGLVKHRQFWRWKARGFAVPGLWLAFP